jgi:hypothetical protein
MSDDLYALIGYQLEATADWRRRQAEYLPNDHHNARAAKELERLAAEVDQLEGSSVHEEIRLAADRLKNEDWFAISKSVYAELRSVGFDSTYESGLRFLECSGWPAQPGISSLVRRGLSAGFIKRNLISCIVRPRSHCLLHRVKLFRPQLETAKSSQSDANAMVKSGSWTLLRHGRPDLL